MQTKDMDVVYICREGDNEELRYSIRSVMENLPHKNIWVVGGKPSWYSGNHIPVRQNGRKYDNARKNMKAIAASSEISEDFILMNDDFFVVGPVNELFHYHGGLLSERIDFLKNKYGVSAYSQMLTKTAKYLAHRGKRQPLDYALHVPFMMNKNNMSSIIDDEVSWRIAYGNLFVTDGVAVEVYDGQSKDVKIYIRHGALDKDGISKNSLTDTFLSSEDRSFDYLLRDLRVKFPDPSPFEAEAEPERNLPSVRIQSGTKRIQVVPYKADKQTVLNSCKCQCDCCIKLHKK
jgi:hypothetical protein